MSQHLPAVRPPSLVGSIRFHPGAATGPLEMLDRISLVMDRLFVLPGTRFRFGINSLLLLLPILGDAVASFVSLGILAIGLSNYRVPRIVAARMVLNSLLDASLGWVPVLGDLFDLFFKADTRNVRLLQEYAGATDQSPRPLWRHWVFVLTALLIGAAVFVLLVLGAVTLVHGIVRELHEGA
jgi:hypothetical protein